MLQKCPLALILGPPGWGHPSPLLVSSPPFLVTVQPTPAVTFSVFPGIAEMCPSSAPLSPLLHQALHPHPLNNPVFYA